MEIVSDIQEIAKKLTETEEERRRLAQIVRKIGERNETILKVKEKSFRDLKVVAVDGGLSKRSLHGFDFVLTRAVGVCFNYKDGKVVSVEYHPSRKPPVKIGVADAYSDLDLAYYTSIMRTKLEIETALQCLDKFKPDIIILDGSIVLHHSDRPSKSSPVFDMYVELLKRYEELYERVMKTSTMLAGVIEDSRSRRFCETIMPGLVLEERMMSILNRTRDTSLLFWVLKNGEMTSDFSYTQNPERHHILKDIDEKYRRIIRSFYLKTVEYDRPVKIDYLKIKEGIQDDISSIIFEISKYNSTYGLPAPLIEADSVAKLSENEAESFYSFLHSIVGDVPGLMKLRREQRPF
ncbi:MAG: hypothetical protein DRP15_02815 [Candidatus Aenigmatarchaeota archaeon]|nr:MAG: hypothetical protein DRP15_02815 [Candidatus Aenigmarchaeota archaeon]